MPGKIKAVVLAAGQGKRLDSAGAGIPKVMRRALGKPLLQYVLAELNFISPSDTVVVVGFMKEAVTEAFPGYVFAVQERQLGTGHAVFSAAAALNGFEGDVLVCCGDMPLMRRESYLSLLRAHSMQENDCTVLGGVYGGELPYGRILRDSGGAFLGIVEEKDCTEEQRAVKELNSGVYVFDKARLFAALAGLGNNNAQGEYYLTDAPGRVKDAGGRVGVCMLPLEEQLLGVNTADQLRETETLLGAR